MTECEWCRAPNPEGSRVCCHCGGALPPGLPANRPASLSRRDRLNLGTVRGAGSPAQVAPLGKTLIGGLHGRELGDPPADRAPPRKPRSMATESGAPYATRQPELTVATPDRGAKTLLGVPSPDAAIVLGPPGERKRSQVPDGKVALSIRGALPTSKTEENPARPAHRIPLKAHVMGALGLIVLAALFGGILALTLPEPQLRVVDFHVTEAGRDVLKVRCVDCPEAAGLRRSGHTAVLSGGMAVFEFSDPLPVGLNRLGFELVEAGKPPRELSLALSVAFRVTVGRSPAATWPPEVEVAVEGSESARIKIAGQEVPLHDGLARHRASLRDQTQGPSSRIAPIEEGIPIEVRDGDETRSTVAHVRATAIPLTYSLSEDASRQGRPWLKGLTLPGALVELRRQKNSAVPLASTRADDHGRFSFSRRRPASADWLLVATLPGHALRWARVRP